MTKTDRAAQVIGELVLYAPLVAACAALGTLVPCLISMTCLFAYKQFYSATVHLDKACQCVTLSYGVFIVVGLFYKGLSHQFWFMQNQPMLLIIIVAGIAWLNANAGQWQRSYQTAMAENKELKAPPPFDCKKATADAILAQARLKKLSDQQAGWIVDKFVRGVTYRQLCRENETEDACYKRITRIVKKLNTPS